MPSTRTIRLVFLSISFALMALPSVAQQWIASVPVGAYPYAVATNSATNKIYVGNLHGNSVTVIDGASFSTVDVPISAPPILLRSMK